ncbi:PhnD/SsuA/transferrin family substrate-binding protein [Oceanicoccus sp. KOV_DT_Chl]|uniref:PhnD/SsuA/transferrin family substrate-binding protein n=1 Tax=Oceanicoccus sp. KOV_DT_Chl TaxID=1904639 RepID=UPI000C7B621B|nr:PhnD/SsuA/transferrin family substrate-binding protein [Oceanicoccus sp. KOV_DT_Chl]
MPILVLILLSLMSGLTRSEEPLIIGFPILVSGQMTRATNEVYTRRMADHMGHPVRFAHYYHDCDLINASLANELDIIAIPPGWASTLISKHHYKVFLQTQARLSLLLVSRNEDPIITIPALTNKRVGRPRKDYEPAALVNSQINNVEGLADSITFVEAGHSKLLVDLLAGRTDAMFNSTLSMSRVSERIRSKLSIVSLAYEAIPAGVLLAKQGTDPDLLKAFHKALTSIPNPLGLEVKYQLLTESDIDAIELIFGLKDIAECSGG